MSAAIVRPITAPAAALRESFVVGEGLQGQCVASRQTVVITDLPPTSRVIGSALAAGPPDVIVCARSVRPKGCWA
ncbi:hypothetical protein [Methylosinus sp. Ce-a6]|uniref:hypothetical protein n=1 Tax=Methylosinus sp. Ce-a6 TaxID=2172005 RepID=UPI00135C0193|nr:hypothetical protein [Methylosinus sp. Ce-a6]